jgi:hypothetical protein
MSVQDKKIISAVFAGSLIIEGFGKLAADYPGFVPIENDVDFLKKSGKEIFVGSVKLGLTAEFSETQAEKRGTQVFGANPHIAHMR